MRILHTSDWHVGKVLKGQSRVDDHIAALLKTYDLNGDGAVTSVEVATVLQSRNRRGHGGGFHR